MVIMMEMDVQLIVNQDQQLIGHAMTMTLTKILQLSAKSVETAFWKEQRHVMMEMMVNVTAAVVQMQQVGHALAL